MQVSTNPDDMMSTGTNPNPKPYFVAVKYGGLASLYRKFTFAISSADEFLVNHMRHYIPTSKGDYPKKW